MRRIVEGWPIALPGAVAGLGVDSREQLHVFHRAGRSWPESDRLDESAIPVPVVAVIDGATGAELRSWGANEFAMPHGLTVGEDDHVWLTDVALHQVFEYSSDGRLLMSLGERGVAGNDVAHFNRPTKVAPAADGSFYVSDGYGNARVMKFARDGTFLFEWGRGFDLVHAVSVDRLGRVYVVDRNNARVQIFDAEGRFLEEWKGAGFGSPYDVAVGTAFIADGGEPSALVVVGANGSILERHEGELRAAHSVAVGRSGAVYVAGLDGRVDKFCV